VFNEHIYWPKIGRKKYKKKVETYIYKYKSIKTYHYNYDVSTKYKCRVLATSFDG